MRNPSDPGMNWTRRQTLRMAGLLATGFGSNWSWAQSPGQVFKLVIPYPPGGSTDIAGRIFATAVGQQLGINIVPDNKGGAAGLIGMQEVARSKPDGLTLGISGIGTTALIGLVHKNPPYVFQRDLDVIGHLGAFGSLVLTRNNAPFQTLQRRRCEMSTALHGENDPSKRSIATDLRSKRKETGGISGNSRHKKAR